MSFWSKTHRDRDIASVRLVGKAFASGLAATLVWLLAWPLKAAPTDSVDITINITNPVPANVTDMGASQGSAVGSINLTWTEPGDDDYLGTASSYTIRASTLSNINDNAQFDAAPPLSAFSTTPLFIPGSGGSLRSEAVTGLEVGTTYYFAIQATDDDTPVNNSSWTRTAGANATNFAVPPGPPADVTDLFAVAGAQEGYIQLSWTEPGDDAYTFLASSYTIRASSQANIADDAAFDGALPLSAFSPSSVPPPGTPRTQANLVVTGLEPGVTYYVAMRANDNDAPNRNNVWSRAGRNLNNFVAAFDAPPSMPTGLNTVSTEGQVALSWSANSENDIAFYRIYRDSTTPANTFVSITTTSALNYTDIGLDNGNSYYYRVTAVDKGPNFLESALTAWVTGFFPAIVTPPAPTLTASLSDITNQQIRWELTDNAINETALYVTTAATTSARLPLGSALNLGPLAGTAGTTGYIETGLSVNTAYTRYAEAFNAGESSFTAAVTRYTLANPPTGLTTSAFNTTGGTVTWNANNNPTNTFYFLERQLNGGAFVSIGTDLSTTTFFDTNFVEGSTHVYRVFARNGDGVVTSSPTYQAIVPRIAPDPVTDLTATSGTLGGSVQLTWTAVGDDGQSGNIINGHYRIDYSTDPNAPHLDDTGVYQIDFATNVTSDSTQHYLVTGLQPGETYSFRVYTLDEALNISTSNAAAAQSTILLDVTRPRLTDYSPQSVWPGLMATNVRTDSVLTVTFDEPMNETSLPGAFCLSAIRNFQGEPMSQIVAGSATYSGQTLTYRPNQPFDKNCTYRITLSTSATDTAGNGLAEPFSIEFRTIFDYSRENTIYADDGRTLVRIPPGAFPDDGFVEVSTRPLQLSFRALASVIQRAQQTEEMRRGLRYAPLVDSIREFELKSAASQTEMSASARRPLELSLPYDDPDNDGFVEGTANGVPYKIHERFLGVVTLNERVGMWVVVPDSQVDPENNRVSVPVNHFSVYAVIPVAADFVGDAFAFPVPYVPTEGHNAITFANLAMEATIRIYTVSGDLVRELREFDGDGQLEWDVKNDDGEEVFSGVYLYVVTSGDEKKTGKLVIIR